MKIGIVGGGHLGSALARRLSRLEHDVQLANSRAPETLSELSRLTGARAATCEGAVLGAALVILAIPFGRVPSLPTGLLSLRAPGAPIVDATNYMVRRDGPIAPLLDRSCGTESVWVERQIGAPVVKAFNTMMAQHLLELGRPYGHLDRLALPAFGNAPAAKRIVLDLIDALGFDAVDGGRSLSRGEHRSAPPRSAAI